MPKAKEVAAELRKLAEGLESDPEAEVSQPWITFWPGKEAFLSLARLLPRPISKKYDANDVTLAYGSPSGTPIYVRAVAGRTLVCRLVEPAKPAVYECEPLLSEAEEAQIGDVA